MFDMKVGKQLVLWHVVPVFKHQMETFILDTTTAQGHGGIL